MNNKKTVFFCGAVLTHEGLKKYKGETPASSIWIRGFLTGLTANGVDVKCFSPIWDSLFPKGKLFPGNIKFLDPKIKQILVRYLNFPFFRTYSVAYSLKRKIEAALKLENNTVTIINYNTYPHYSIALKKIAKKYPELIWINLILDLDDPIKDNWGKFTTDTIGSKGFIFLSWWGFQNSPVKNKMHLDGGWTGKLPTPKQNNEIVFLYAGKFDVYGGIKEIIDAILLMKDENIVFEFYGKGFYQPLTDLSLVDKRVKVIGFVTDEELDKACKKATAFLSPREFDFQGTKMIFPSKILFYLKYQKPILSALLPGLSPEYSEVLISPSDNTPQAWADSMSKVIHFSITEQNLIIEKSNLLLNKKEWKIQTQRVVPFIENL